MEKCEQSFLKFGGTASNRSAASTTTARATTAASSPPTSRSSRGTRKSTSEPSLCSATRIHTLPQFLCHFAHNPQFSSQIAQIPALIWSRRSRSWADLVTYIKTVEIFGPVVNFRRMEFVPKFEGGSRSVCHFECMTVHSYLNTVLACRDGMVFLPYDSCCLS